MRSHSLPSWLRISQLLLAVTLVAGLILAFAPPSGCRAAGGFTDIGAGLPGVYLSSAAWGDYDNDGRLDILLTGDTGWHTPIAKVYHNNGDGTFSDIGAGLPGVYYGSAVWGDYDNDGRLDILLTGFTNSDPIARVYHNNGDGTFTDISAGLPGVATSSVAWGDYDNDGWLDILLAGYALSGPMAQVYHNNGDGTFTDIGAGLPGAGLGSVAWGDYDNDGRLDILLAGYAGSGEITQVYHNNGDGTFTDINAGLPGFLRRAVAWGDYDYDGRLDILLAGYALSGPMAQVYHNNGDGTFTDIGAGLPEGYAGAAAWGDYDNDGRLDILLTGTISSGRIARVYHNKGNGAFTDIRADLQGAELGAAAWGDYDNDGRLDILITGSADSGNIARVYHNNGTEAGTHGLYLPLALH